MARDDSPVPAQPGSDPAQEKTLPYDHTPSARETISGKASSADTVKDRRPKDKAELAAPADSPAQDRGPTPSGAPANGAPLISPPTEHTLEQDEQDRQSAQQSSVCHESPPAVPGYRFLERLGHGTYGVVWRALEESTNKQVAVKFFHRRVGAMWQIVCAEIKQLAMLDAVPGIIQLKDADPEATPPFFVMSYAEGGSLAALLRKGELPVPKALELFRTMAGALAYVHAKGIRHCDLKPANILLDALGKPLIADFGQAHLSLESQASSINLGTFYYMAPEQADLTRQIPDTRWDVYGLGAIFYCMVTGQPPRASSDLTGELNNTSHLSSRLERYRDGVAKAPPPVKHHGLPGMDRSLAEIIDKCLHLDPAQRYQNASDVLQALDQREKYLRQRPMLLFGLAASLFLVVALGLLASMLVHFAVRDTQAALQAQILENDRTTVHLIANVVGEELDDRKEIVERLAQSKNLVDKVQDFFAELKPEQIKSQAYIKNKSAEALEAHLVQSYRPGVGLLIVYDLTGNLLVGAYPERNPDNTQEGVKKRQKRREKLQALYGINYAYRDYYHGKGDNRVDPGEKRAYIGRTYVSEPYVSTLVDEDVLMAISTPIYALKSDAAKERPVPDKDKLIGILIGFIYLEDLHSWLKGVELTHGSAVLVNQHGQCVYHTDPKHRTELMPQKGKALSKWPKTQQVIAANHLRQLADYEDEMTDLACLASFASLPEEGWGAMVLHYRVQVFEPIQELKTTLYKVIGVVAAICAAMLAGVWLWLLRAVRGKDTAKPAATSGWRLVG